MFKLSRNALLIIFLIALLIVPAYSESNEIEHPIIFIPAGAPLIEYLFFATLVNKAGIKADLLYDLNAQILDVLYSDYSFLNCTFGEIESGKYKTAVFVFGTIDPISIDPRTTYPKYTNINEVIRDLNKTVNYCMQNEIRMVGLLFCESEPGISFKYDMIKVIEEFVPHMELLMVLRKSNHWPDIGDKFIEVGKENEIPIDFFAASKVTNSYSSLAIQELSIKFGE